MYHAPLEHGTIELTESLHRILWYHECYEGKTLHLLSQAIYWKVNLSQGTCQEKRTRAIQFDILGGEAVMCNM